MARLFSPWLLGACILGINLLFVAIAALVGWFPSIVAFLHRALRAILINSYRLYNTLLKRMDPIADQALGIHVRRGTPRVLATIAISLLLMAILLALTPLDLSLLNVILAVLHGLLVGIVWEDALEFGSLHMGSRLQ